MDVDFLVHEVRPWRRGMKFGFRREERKSLGRVAGSGGCRKGSGRRRR